MIRNDLIRQRRKTHLFVMQAVLLLLAPSAAAQESGAAPETPAAGRQDDLAHGRALLEDVRDNVFSFDDPAFYWFRNYVRQDQTSMKYDVREEEEWVPWQYLMERPSDYRGQLVAIEGRLLRIVDYELPNRPGAGTWYQCELGQRGTSAICTVVLTDEPPVIPHKSLVRTKGYFIKVRAFRTNTGQTGAGPLLVARRLQLVSQATAESGSTEGAVPRMLKWMVGGTVLMAALWLLLRRRVASPRTQAPLPPGSGRRITGSSEDFEWLTGPEDRDAQSGNGPDAR